MRVAAFTGFNGLSDLTIQETDEPEPGPTEVVLDVAACSLNSHDLAILEGNLPIVDEDDLPFVSGLDVAGEVAETGSAVDSLSTGDRVLLCPNQTCGVCQYCREGPENICEQYGVYHGGLAEKALVEADRLITLPESVDSTTAAALPAAYMTAYHMMRRIDVSPNDLVLVPGATGGVGVASIQLVDAIGARSIGTTTSPAKADQLDAVGVDYVIESGDIDEIRESVEEVGEPDSMLDHLGGEFVQLGIDLLRRDGRMAVCGGTAGRISEIDISQVFAEHKRIIGSSMGTQPDLETIVGLCADGVIEPVIQDEYVLDDIDQAFADLKNRDVFGKLIVHP